MSTLLRSTSILFLLFLTLALVLPATAKQFVQCSVRIDGQKTFKVDSIYPDKKVYLEVNGLASAMGWRVMPVNNGRSVRLDSKTFHDLKEYNRKTYVSADEIGQQFGYEVKDSQSGLVVDFWTKSGGQTSQAAPTNYGLRVLKKEKTTSPNPEYDMYKLTLEVKNPTSTPSRINAKGFRLVDDKGQSYSCEGSFDIGVPAKKSVQVERVYFSIPRMATPKTIRLLDEKNQEIGTARF
jgi:hypothetical protein